LYTSWMDLHGAPDALRYRMFSLTLGEKAQRWYHSLTPHSIAKWSQLKSMFRTHSIGSQACRIPKESITHIIQGADESLKNYITRFNERVQNMEPCHQETLLVSAYSGLRPKSMFKWTLCQNKPQTYHEFLMKAQQHIMAEENMSVPSFPALNEKIAEAKESRPNKEFVKDERISQFRAMQRKHHEELTNSYQGVYSAGAAVVYEELKNKGIIPDPRPIRVDEENLDKSRYCAYHKAHGHNTDQSKAMPRNSNTIPLSMPLTTNPTEHPTHTHHDPETHVATSHATSQLHHTSPRREERTHVTVNPVTNNQAPDQPSVQDMTAETHSAHHQRISPRPRPISSAPHAREDLRRQIERNRLSRHSAEEIETLRKRLAELETRQKSQEDSTRHVTMSGNVIIETDSPLAPELTAEALPVKVKIPQIGMYDGTSDPDAHLGHYTSWMDLHGASDALRCQMFSLTLGPRAQKWYILSHLIRFGNGNSCMQLSDRTLSVLKFALFRKNRLPTLCKRMTRLLKTMCLGSTTGFRTWSLVTLKL
ncbi:Unknown protein, partial [Striga hermonthica]